MKLEIELSEAQLAAIAERLAQLIAECQPNAERWLDTNGAAEYLGCHPVTLRKLAAQRRIEFEQEGPGCKMYFRTAVLDAHRGGNANGPA